MKYQEILDEITGWIGVIFIFTMIILGIISVYSMAGWFLGSIILGCGVYCVAIDVYNNRDEIFR